MDSSLALHAHTRRFLGATIGVVLPLAALLTLFPRHTAVTWMWAMRDPRSAVLVGTVYVGAIVYYLLALRSDDWLEAQAGLEGVFVVSAVLLLAVVLDWPTVRSWHLTTLFWMPAYYAPLFFVPYLFRLQGGWRLLPETPEPGISPAAAAWLTVRGIGYAMAAVLAFMFAGPLAQRWPWPIDPIELRMFCGQPATFILPGLAVLRGNLRWRRHRLPLLYLGTLGVVQLGALLVLRTPYDRASILGVLLPLVFAEWILTPLVLLRRAAPRGASVPAIGGPEDTGGRWARAVTYGVRVLGFGYLAIGVLGFLPIEALNPLRIEGVRYLLRHFAVDTPHNLVHLAIGITGLWASSGLSRARRWGMVVGAVLLALFVAGLAQAAGRSFPLDQSLLGVALNSPGHVFHLTTGVLALIYGLMRIAGTTRG